MSIARKIMLLAGMALAVLAMTATTASAQETEVEVVNEPSGDPCNPCTIHVEGEARITALPSGVIVSQCEDEFEGVINHDGSGEVEWLGVAHGGPGCPLVNCTLTEGEDHWPISALGELSTGVEHATVRFCLMVPPDGPELHCDAEVDITDTGSHIHRFHAHELCAGGAREVEGTWLQETTDPNHDAIEIVHHAP